MKAPDVVTIDFETYPIAQRPAYPPEPVGVAIKYPREASHYYAWGHPTGNNCSEGDGREALGLAWDCGLPVLFHNAKFDLAVACEGFCFPMPPWDRVHDTMFLAYLNDPHSRSLGLKDLAAEQLNWPPDERDAVAEWVVAHSAQLTHDYRWNGSNAGKDKISTKKAGAWIFAASGDLVAPYACGDVGRTAALFEELWPLIQEHGMGPAYDRERELMPILMENERLGMQCDTLSLSIDIRNYSADLKHTEDWLRKELRATGLNFDADQDVASVLVQRGIVLEGDFARTAATKTHPDGQLSMSKETLRPELFTGQNGAGIASALGYRNRLTTCLKMFMEPWLAQAERYNGYITTNWNQVRSPSGGTRTGRPSTNEHNFLNISKSFDGRDDGYVHPEFLEVARLPLCRRYILPDPGEVFLHRDFDGQEMRIFAHGEQGDLNQKFNDNPALDPHAFIGDELMRVAGREIERTKVKVLNFQSLYGGGIPALQAKLRCSVAEAKQLKRFHDAALPGRVTMNEVIKQLVGCGMPIRTLGGRLYFVEPKRMVEGRLRDFVYKLINYWVQGSAADYTKECLIQWHHAKRNSRFLVTVYDEINISAPHEYAEHEMALLREVMEKDRLTVPMRSSGKCGPNWGELTKCP